MLAAGGLQPQVSKLLLHVPSSSSVPLGTGGPCPSVPPWRIGVLLRRSGAGSVSVPRAECQAAVHTPLSTVCAVIGLSSAQGFIAESWFLGCRVSWGGGERDSGERDEVSSETSFPRNACGSPNVNSQACPPESALALWLPGAGPGSHTPPGPCVTSIPRTPWDLLARPAFSLPLPPPRSTRAFTSTPPPSLPGTALVFSGLGLETDLGKGTRVGSRAPGSGQLRKTIPLRTSH